MSEAANLLREYSKTAPAGVVRGRSASELLAARAAGELPDEQLEDGRPPKPTTGQLMYDMETDRMGGGGAEVLANMASGAAGAAAGGLRGLWHMWEPAARAMVLAGSGVPNAAEQAGIPQAVEQATDLINRTTQAITYQPRDPAEAQAAATAGHAMEWMGPKEGRFVGELAQDLGAPPWAATALDTATQAALPVALFKGLQMAGARVSPLLEKPETPVRSAADPQSMGAAAARIDTSRLSEGLRGAIERASVEGPLNRAVVDRHVDADTLPVPVRLSEGQALQDPALISKEMNLRGKNPERAQFYQLQNRQLLENMDEIRAEAGPTVVHRDHVQNGQALIDYYKEVDAPVLADIDAKYGAMRDAAAGDFPIDTQALLSNVRAALKKDLATSKAPADVMGALEEAAAAGKMDFETFEGLRTSLARIARSSADGNERHAAGVIRNQIEELPLAEGSSKELKALADEARSAYRARQEKLKEDPAYRAAVEDGVKAGEFSPEADAFVRKFVVNGKKVNLQHMQENLAANPEAAQTIAVSALNYLKNGAEGRAASGNFSQAGYNSALNHLSPRLEYLMPETTAEMAQQLGRVANYTQFQPRGSFVNNSNTFVSQAAEGAKGAIEGAANQVAGGVPVGSFVRKKLEGRAEEREWQKAIQPGAGVKLKTLLDKGKKAPEKKK